ncbi:MAG: hypothetical protein ACLUG9_02950 [Paraclostridium sordellii]
MSKKFKLEKRIVVFLDILGFSHTVLNDPQNAKKIMHVLDDSVKSLKAAKKDHDLDSLKITWFSDSIIISDSEVNIGALSDILNAIENIQSFLCLSQITIRGGVSIGDCYHTGNNVFGEAMVRAYELEGKAITPRVILGDEVIEMIEKDKLEQERALEQKYEYDLEIYKNSPKEMEEITKEYSNRITESDMIMSHLIKVDKDGRYYIDYIRELLSRAVAFEKYDEKFCSDRYKDTILPIRECIENGLRHKNESVRNKYAWIAEKYNNEIKFIIKTVNKDFLNDFKNKTLQIIEYETVTLIEYKEVK